MKILRLLLFEKCNRNCDGCCNKDWDLKALPVEKDFSPYSMVLLTGGEPMLKPHIIIDTAVKIRSQSSAKIYLYTAKVNDLAYMSHVLIFIDGITVTLHRQLDVKSFMKLDQTLPGSGGKSLRLNIFKGVKIKKPLRDEWKIKSDIEWIQNCPLPKNEVLKRI